MGCDIHMFIEYKRPSDISFLNFGGNYDGIRNYQFFGLLAKGVRVNDNQAIPLRDLPDFETLGYETQQQCSIVVTDEFYGDVNEISKKEAEMLVATGKSRFLDIHKRRIINEDTHSWLTAAELESQLTIYQKQLPQNYNWLIEYIWILEIMKMIERSGYDTRLVFWFRN